MLWGNINSNEQPITQAYLEEMELLVAIISMVFLHADTLIQIDPGFLYAIKDCLIFGIPHLISNLK